MSPMTDARQRDNVAYWESKKAEFRFHAQAPTLEPSPSDFADFLSAASASMDFLAVPMGDSVTYWGFSTAADRAAFLSLYPSATELAAEAVFGNPV